MKKITLNELRSLIRQTIKEEARKKLVNESSDYFSDTDNAYIGRTEAYYSEEDDDNLYEPDYWTYSTDINDKDFAEGGELYKLTDDGKEIINKWLNHKGRSQYQIKQMGYFRDFNIEGMNNEEMWDYLTEDKTYSKRIR